METRLEKEFENNIFKQVMDLHLPKGGTSRLFQFSILAKKYLKE